MANTPIDYIRYAADQALSVPNQINLRPYKITITTVTWSGDRVGVGTSTDGYTTVYNANGVNPRFREISCQDVILSNGKFEERDVCIGPIVMPYETDIGNGGTSMDVFTPNTSGQPMDWYVLIEGPSEPVGGTYFKKIYDDTDKNVMYKIYLRKVSANVPI